MIYYLHTLLPYVYECAVTVLLSLFVHYVIFLC